ncbi:alginate export family protein [Reichenbachiella sp. MALMAid0571]|uniref:alginate export family protein n=1 Tax=Reichenbachiella sp. MALMAid0571 TaxID=3143939 RepID=UPI0032DF5EC1
MNKSLTLIVFLVLSQQAFSQFSISGEIRPRYEFRNGYQSLSQNSSQFGSFTDQRTRINFDFKNNDYIFRVVMQDVRTWGSQSQLVNNDGSLTSIHEAWAEVLFTSKYSLRAGRQEIVYDDHRIFGNVGWAQQARSHDAAVAKYKTDNFKLEMGFAFNQDRPNSTDTYYSVSNSYKAFQYIWAHHARGDFKGSFLFLNNGIQAGTPTNYRTVYSQTTGVHFEYKKNAISSSINLYHQSGEHSDGSDINANLIGLDVDYKTGVKTSVFVGYEMMSGNDQVGPGNKNKAFTPFYGTNHKFNGYMDYFYVGNHINSVGLSDIYFGAKTAISKMNLYGALHIFASTGKVSSGSFPNTMSKALGEEVDLSLSYKVKNDVVLQCGYSQMFATDTMEALKGGNKNKINNWAWVMITFKPLFFQSKSEKNE